MKKVSIVLLVLVLLLAGLFFWKGGHHALFLADRLEDWLGEDAGAASVTLQLQQPGFSADPETGKLMPQVRQLSLTAEGGWSEYADRTLYMLKANEIAAYFHEGVLYLDSGRAYILPEPSGLVKPLRELLSGLILYGRVTKTADTYTVSMDTDKLELDATVTVDQAVRAMTVTALLPDGTALQATLTPKAPDPAPIPQAVADAMVRSKLEPPMALSELLEVLLPAAEQLLPMSADLTLGVECGILELSETVDFTMDTGKAELERKGALITIDLPPELSSADPAALALLLLRNGDFSRDADTAIFRLTLPAETTDQLCAALVPQIGQLGVTFSESEAVLTIRDQQFTEITMTAEGSVPFLVTTIPVSFQAQFDIH